MILGNIFNLKSIFEKKLSVWQILRKSFKNLKNHLYYFLEKYLIGNKILS